MSKATTTSTFPLTPQTQLTKDTTEDSTGVEAFRFHFEDNEIPAAVRQWEAIRSTFSKVFMPKISAEEFVTNKSCEGTSMRYVDACVASANTCIAYFDWYLPDRDISELVVFRDRLLAWTASTDLCSRKASLLPTARTNQRATELVRLAGRHAQQADPPNSTGNLLPAGNKPAWFSQLPGKRKKLVELLFGKAEVHRDELIRELYPGETGSSAQKRLDDVVRQVRHFLTEHAIPFEILRKNNYFSLVKTDRLATQ